MLFFAAAILYSSVNVLGVTGPLAVPSHADAPSETVSASTSEVATVAAPSSAVPSAAVRTVSAASVELSAPVEGVPVDIASDLTSCGADASGSATSATISDLSAASCLDALGTASATQLLHFDASLDVDSGQDLAFAQELGAGAAGADLVHAWWAQLASSQRRTIADALPNVVGNLEGVPYAVRDRANRATLSSTIRSIERSERLANAGITGRPSQASRLTMLEQVSRSLISGYDGNDTARGLVSLDTVLPGRAAVAVGDLDTAKNVSVMVPGMLYTVSSQMVSFTNAAAAIQSSQTFWSNTLANDTTGPQSSAVVSWMGYRTPTVTNVLGLSLAKVGAVHLENAVEGLDAVRSGDVPRTTIIAHSYGSTTATIALSSKTIHVDDFVALGSPGSVVPDAADLAVTSGHVYAAAAALDPVAGSSVFGADPGSVLFGSTLLNLGSMVDPYTSQAVTAVVTHNEYFTTGSHSMRSLALIGIGRGDLVDGRSPVPDGPQLATSPNLAFVRPQDVVREAIQQA